MDFKFLTELQKIQEEKLEKQMQEAKRQNSNVNMQQFVNNKGESYKKDTGKL